ncbi:hypothetical protein [Winogradskyella damuponensis]|uniref:Apea-like HEPN domain-containing protein n=1 Tax=Winogradskyella damuponensis TaxID=943939 RepID=A0ABP8CLN1_9FLAO
MIEKLNNEAKKLTKLLTVETIIVSKTKPKLTGTNKEKDVIDISDKIVGDFVERSTDHIGNTTSIFKSDKKQKIGFTESDYPQFKLLIEKLYSFGNISRITTLDFIQTHSFDWIVSHYKNDSENSIYEHIIKVIKDKIEHYTFYFPMFNLEIESSFKIGNVEFTFLTKDYFDRLYQRMKSKDETVTEENFKQIFRKDFQGQVLVKTTVQAEKSKAEKLAQLQAEIAVDILKLYGETAIVPEKRTMFDLNFRLGYQLNSNYLSEIPGTEDSLSLNMRFNNSPFFFSKRHFNSAQNGGLSLFSNYLKLNRNSEIHNLTIQSIKLFGSAISNWDLHLRCVSLITILESVLLKENEDNKMEQRVKARLSKILTNEHKKKEEIKDVFGKIYLIRHKMVHKAKRLPIDFNELRKAQIHIIELFMRLIDLDTKFGVPNKNSLIDFLNNIKS